MAETVRPYDAANYLRDEEDIAAYLQAAAEDGDPTGIAMALGAVARARSMSQLARDTGITREGLYKALSPGGNPSFATVAKVAAALGHPITFGVPAYVAADDGEMPDELAGHVGVMQQQLEAAAPDLARRGKRKAKVTAA